MKMVDAKEKMKAGMRERRTGFHEWAVAERFCYLLLPAGHVLLLAAVAAMIKGAHGRGLALWGIFTLLFMLLADGCLFRLLFYQRKKERLERQLLDYQHMEQLDRTRELVAREREKEAEALRGQLKKELGQVREIIQRGLGGEGEAEAAESEGRSAVTAEVEKQSAEASEGEGRSAVTEEGEGRSAVTAEVEEQSTEAAEAKGQSEGASEAEIWRATDVMQAEYAFRGLLRQAGQAEEGSFCGNALVNTVLEEKLRACETFHIRLDAKVRIPAGIAIGNYDLCSVFSNLLDNAIDACRAMPSGAAHRTVSVRADVRGDYLFIRVSNPARQEYIERPGKMGHGLGREIVGRIARACHGEYWTSAEDGVYTALVVLRCEKIK